MEFYTKYRRPKHNGSEPGGGQLVVERAGYVDTKTQIENFIRSGSLCLQFLFKQAIHYSMSVTIHKLKHLLLQR